MKEQYLTLLSMIDEYDGIDKDKKQEINTRVWCWLNRVEFRKPLVTKSLRTNETRIYAYRTSIGDISTWRPPNPQGTAKWEYAYRHNFVESRDALKRIRPDGWAFSICPQVDGTWTIHFTNDKEDFTIPDFDTEELAELYAILHAINHDRGSDGK